MEAEMSRKGNNKAFSNISRRQFIKNFSCSIAGAQIAAGNLDSFSKVFEKPDNEDYGKMKYRTLGRTGLKISEISLGGHYNGIGWREKNSKSQKRRNEVIGEAAKLGINFLDSNEVTESKTIGTALYTLGIERERVYLSGDTNAYKDEENYNNRTKMMDEIFKEVDEHLEKLKTSYMDIFRLTTVSLPYNREGVKNGVEAFKVLKKEGKARFFGISNHNPKDLYQMIDEIPELDVLFIPYSYVTTRAEKAMALAKKKNIGVIAIKPFVQGSFFKLTTIDFSTLKDEVQEWLNESGKTTEGLMENAKLSLALANLKYLLNNKDITTVIPGMETAEEVRENVRASYEGKITEKEIGLLQDFWNSPQGETFINEMCSGKYHFLRQWKCG